MAEWEQQLQQLLNDPGAMGRIVEMAQQLGGAMSQENTQDAPQEQSTSTAAQSAPLPDFGLDSDTLARLLPLVREWRQPNAQASQLLYALQPFLKPEKQSKVERALRLAHLIHIGKKAVADGGLGLV